MSPAALPVLRDDEFSAFRGLIRDAAGIHLTDAKRQLVASRLAPRLRHYGYTRYHDYFEHVTCRDRDGTELRQLVNCITTNKTDFFREAHHFRFLEEHVFPLALRRTRPLLVWSAGCSTGEEPYTLAMIARRYFGSEAPRRLRIIASDIDTAVLAHAKQGVYDETRLADVPEPLRRASFLRGTGHFAGTARVRPELAELLEFRHVNLTAPAWPVTEEFDAIFCRNVIIYFDQQTRLRLIGRFAERIRPGGFLALGHSESMPPELGMFEPLGATMFQLRGGRPQPARPEARLQPEGTQRRRIVAGEVFASNAPIEITTVLGSCVAACLHDPEAGIGGMNHFMLPHAGLGTAGSDSARYGVHAMELLINEILRLGGDRRRIVAKVFGGAAVLRLGTTSVADDNIAFIRDFCALEGIPILAERLGGSVALEVRMQSDTARVRVRELTDVEGRAAATDDQHTAAAYLQRLTTQQVEPTLF